MPLNVTLASSLLDLEIDQHRQAKELGGRTFRTGVVSLDRDLPGAVWRGGNVVAIGTDRLGIKQGSLPLELIATYLLESSTNSDPNTETNSTPLTAETTPSVFIIAPPYQATATIQRLYTMLKARLQQIPKPATSAIPPNIETQTKSYLSRTSLLQYLDISGLAESISEVLHTVTEPESSSHPPPSQRRSIVLLQGLTNTITTTHRRTGTLRTAALLSSIIQGLRNIARTSLRSGGSSLVLMEVDIVWDGGVTATVTDDASRVQHSLSSDGGGGASGNTTMKTTVTSGLKSAFSSRTGKVLRVNMGMVYARMVLEAVDVFVAVHDGEGRIGKGENGRIVECVRDERAFVGFDGVDGDMDGMGEGNVEDGNREVNSFGSWAVWD